MIPSHVSIISFSRVQTLAQACNSCHANSCLSCIRTCLHIFVFFNCALSQVCLLCQRTQTHTLAVHTHTHARTCKRSPTRLCTFPLSGTFAALVYICRYVPDMPLAFSAAKQLCIPGAAHRAGKSVCQRSRVRLHNSPRSQRAAGLKWVVFNFFYITDRW